MGLQASWGEAEAAAGDLASNRGWSDFGRWAQSLPTARYGQVVRLVEHGYVRDVGLLVADLTAAVSGSPPHDPTVRATADNLLALARRAGAAGADHLAVTDGTGPAEGEDETDEEAAHFD